MKKVTTLLLLFLIACTDVYSQNGINNNTQDQHKGLFSTKGMSPTTAFLLVDMMRMERDNSQESKEKLIEKYNLIEKNGQLYVNSLLLEDAGFSTTTLESIGVLLSSQSGKIHTGLVPIDRVANIAENATIKYIDIGKKLYMHMDSARSQTNVEKVHQGVAPLAMPYTGDGVVVGVIDIGFDYTHPNFYDSTGTDNYRVKRVWDQKSSSGNPPFGYGYGTELKDKASILNQATDDNTMSHGTHTAGTAAGAGGYPNSPYRGVAYKSDIVLVAAILNDAFVADAIRYIQAYADSVNKPCVINMSFGGHEHAHDGTDLASRYYDNLSDTGKLLVASAGNDGGDNIYFGNKFHLADTITSTFLRMADINLASGFGGLYATCEPNANFSIEIALLNRAPFGLEAKIPYKVSASISSVDTFILYDANNIPAVIEISSGIDPLNNKPTIFCVVTNYTDRYVMANITGYNTSVNMWALGQGVSFSDMGYGGLIRQFRNGSTDHTVGNTDHSTIVVGAYTSKKSWVSLNNEPQNAPFYAPVGEIAPFSSKGPTADGRTKPDIAAPGNVIISSVNSFDNDYSSTDGKVAHSVTVDPQTWYFGAMQGTSMSAPMVTGIVALWLEKYPKLTRNEALDMMKKTAITDSYTGAIPTGGSNTWGWGKINAYDAMVTVSVVEVAKEVKLKIYPNPATDILHIGYLDNVTKSDIVLYDVTGKVLYSKHLDNIGNNHTEKISTAGLANGIYLLKVVNDNYSASYRVVKQ